MSEHQPIKLDYAPRETKPKNGWFFRLSCALFAVLLLIGLLQAAFAAIERTAPLYEGIIAAAVDVAAITFFVWLGIRGKHPWR